MKLNYCKCCGQEIVKLPKIRWTKIGELYWSECLGEMGWDKAVKKCKKLKGRLPTRLELLDLYDNHNKECNKLITAKPGSPDNYWSSTEISYDPTTAWGVYLYDGTTFYVTKGTAYWVRCVRRGKEKNETKI